MSDQKKKVRVSLLDMPNYVYDKGQLACPECYKPVARGRADGRCDYCLRNKDILPVNWLRPVKKKSDEDEEEEERPRRRNREE